MRVGKREETDTELKVFISYSRHDEAFAQELRAGLMACGFGAYLDRADIAPAEAWEDRLSALIQSCDTVVFVVSPAAIESKRCAWEVGEAARHGKRICPVVWVPVDEKSVPEALRRLNFIFFSEGRAFGSGLQQLQQALNTDFAWVREHTRLNALAFRWDQRGKPDTLLLRGQDLLEAHSWRAAQPTNAPLPNATLDTFLAKSEAGEKSALAEESKRLAAIDVAQQKTAAYQKTVLNLLISIGIGLIILAGWVLYTTMQNRLVEVVSFVGAAHKAVRDGHHDKAMRLGLNGISAPGSLWPAGIFSRVEQLLYPAIKGGAMLSRMKLKLVGHSQFITSAEYSRDGRFILTTSYDKTATVWDATTGRALHVLHGHHGAIRSGMFDRTGEKVLTVSEDDKSVRVWSTATGERTAVIPYVKSGFGFLPSDIRFSPRGNRIVVPGEGGVELWDGTGGTRIATLEGTTAVRDHRAFDVDSDLITVKDGKAIRFYALEDGRLVKSLPAPGEDVCIAFTADRKRALISSSYAMSIWDIAEEKLILEKRFGQRLVNLCPSFLHGERYIIAVLWDGVRLLRTHDLETAESSDARLFQVSASGDMFALQKTGSVELFAMSDAGSRRIGNIPTSNSYPLYLFSEVAGGSHIVIRTWQGADLWRLAPRLERVAQYNDPQSVNQFGPISLSLNSVIVAPDGQSFLMPSDSGQGVRMWDAREGPGDVLLPDVETNPTAIVISEDDTYAAVTYGDGAVRVWELATGRLVGRLHRPGDKLSRTAISSNGRQVATVSEDGTVRLWDAQVETELPGCAGLKGNDIKFLSGSAKLLIDGAKLCDTRTGSAESVVESDDRLELSPSRESYVLVRKDAVELWDVSRNAKLKSWPKSGDDSIRPSYSPNGKYIALESAPAKIAIVNATDGSTASEMSVPGQKADNVYVSADGRHLLLRYRDKVTILDAKSGATTEMKSYEPEVSLTVEGSTLVVSDGYSASFQELATGNKARDALPPQGEWVRQSRSKNLRLSIAQSRVKPDKLALWDDFEGGLIAEFDDTAFASFAHSGAFLATSWGKGGVRIWNLQWTNEPGPRLKERACAEKLRGARRITSADASEAIIYRFVYANPCTDTGPLTFKYWRDLVGLW